MHHFHNFHGFNDGGWLLLGLAVFVLIIIITKPIPPQD